MRNVLLGLALVAVTFAGCIADDATEMEDKGPLVLDEPWVNPVQLIDEGHDHADPAQHDISNNMTLVGFESLGGNGPPGAISEIDVAGDYAFIGIMGYGFQVVDISNATAPKLVASVEVTSPDQQLPTDVYLADLKVDRDGDWVFVALELSTTPGVLIYDARDKSNISLAGFWPEPGLLLGCHMIEYAIIAEQEYLFCAPLDNALYVGLLLPPVGEPGLSVREVAQVTRWMPTSQDFVSQQGTVAADRVTACAGGDANACAAAALHFVSGHQDMTHQIDPLTGADVLTVSFWNLGLFFLDVSIPAVPLEIGYWAGEDAERWDGAIHTAMTFESDGRRIAIASPEGAQPATIFLLDATDLNNPVTLTEWAPRYDYVNESGPSMHNFQIVDGKLYLAMYHGGIWVLDVSTPELVLDPHAIGTYMPWVRGEGPEDPAYGRGCCGGIMAWDVVVHQGYVLTANAGFYVLHVDGQEVGVEAPSSFA